MRCRMLVGSILVLCAMVAVIPVASADTAATRTSKGWAYLRVEVSDLVGSSTSLADLEKAGDVYGVFVWLSRGSIHNVALPPGWACVQSGSRELLLLPPGPMAAGDWAEIGLKVAGNGAWTEWLTLTNATTASGAAWFDLGPVIGALWSRDWGYVDLK